MEGMMSEKIDIDKMSKDFADLVVDELAYCKIIPGPDENEEVFEKAWAIIEEEIRVQMIMNRFDEYVKEK
jgi:hypothetical protein